MCQQPRRFRLLTGSSRTAVPRQQTLHELLLARLSVFAGSASLPSVTTVVMSTEIPVRAALRRRFGRPLPPLPGELPDAAQ